MQSEDFFFNDTSTPEIYTLSLHDALPIWWLIRRKFVKIRGSLEVLEVLRILEILEELGNFGQRGSSSLFVKYINKIRVFYSLVNN